MLKFTIDDLDIGIEYEFIKKDLRDIIFFIELNYEKIDKYDYRPYIDFIWDIGYIIRDKRVVNCWVDIIEENVDKFKYVEEEENLYIDFLNEFEDKCVEKSYEFEELVDEELSKIYGE